MNEIQPYFTLYITGIMYHVGVIRVLISVAKATTNS